MAQMRSADRAWRRLMLEVDRTYRGHHKTDASDPKRTSGLNGDASVSGPEPVLPELVALIFAKVGHLSVFHPPDVNLRKRRGQPVSFCIHSDQGDNEITFSQHVVHINAKHASGKLHRALKEASDLIVAGKFA